MAKLDKNAIGVVISVAGLFGAVALAAMIQWLTPYEQDIIAYVDWILDGRILVGLALGLYIDVFLSWFTDWIFVMIMKRKMSQERNAE